MNRKCQKRKTTNKTYVACQNSKTRISRRVIQKIRKNEKNRTKRYYIYFITGIAHMPQSLQQLIDALAKLPGIGEKTAMKLAFYIVTKKIWLLQELSERMLAVEKNIWVCPRCYGLKDLHEETCTYCRDISRDGRVICIIEEYADLLAIEQTGVFKWLYHVLGGSLSPLHGRGPKELNFSWLFQRLENIEEVILATNPNFEWEATALYLRDTLPAHIKISRLSRGLPNAGYIDYVDSMTLMNALKWRQEYR